MAVILGLLAFLVLLSCAVILRERKLRRGWQRVLGRVLQERGTHETGDGLRSDVAGAGVNEQQQSLARWMSQLKRAFHSFEKFQQKAARLERQIRTLEET